MHRTVLAYRAWDLLALTGKEHAHTTLRRGGDRGHVVTEWLTSALLLNRDRDHVAVVDHREGARDVRRGALGDDATSGIDAGICDRRRLVGRSAGVRPCELAGRVDVALEPAGQPAGALAVDRDGVGSLVGVCLHSDTVCVGDAENTSLAAADAENTDTANPLVNWPAIPPTVVSKLSHRVPAQLTIPLPPLCRSAPSTLYVPPRRPPAPLEPE